MTLTQSAPKVAPRRRWTPEDDRLGRRLLIHERRPPSDAARRMGVSVNALTSRAKREGWKAEPAAPAGPLHVGFSRASTFGGARAIIANAERWAAHERQPADDAPVSLVQAVGRPWLERADDACACIVAGEGWTALACCAPGRARKRGHGAYCAAHEAEIYRPRPDAAGEGGR